MDVEQIQISAVQTRQSRSDAETGSDWSRTCSLYPVQFETGSISTTGVQSQSRQNNDTRISSDSAVGRGETGCLCECVAQRQKIKWTTKSGWTMRWQTCKVGWEAHCLAKGQRWSTTAIPVESVITSELSSISKHLTYLQQTKSKSSFLYHNPTPSHEQREMPSQTWRKWHITLQYLQHISHMTAQWLLDQKVTDQPY